MRLHEELIKQGILHSEPDVRSEAVLYFSRSYTHDPSILPLVIEAIERYGWDDAFEVPYCISGLPLNDATLSWVLAQLQHKDAKKPDAYGYTGRWHTLNSLLSNADAELLAQHLDAIIDVLGIETVVIETMSQRVTLLTTDTEACWSALEQFCVDAKDVDDIGEVDLDYAYALIEAIARRRDQHAEKVLSILGETIEDLESNPKVWMETFAVRMAGEMRLDAAVPLILDKLKEVGEEAEWLCQECEAALAKIGGDATVQAAADLFRHGEWHLRMAACNVLDHVHSDLAVAKALELLPAEDSLTVRAFLASGMISHFAFDVIEPMRQIVHDGSYDESYSDLKHDLVVAATLMGVDFPEREVWTAEAKQKQLERKTKLLKQESERLEQEKRRLRAEVASLEQEKQRLQDQDYESEPSPQRRVGRNDPCPCGSGKKFKRCCLKKQGDADVFD
ncbi:MAG: SEC-C metal-binding domain-containing protein [Thermoguttaceae bacterium]